MFSLLICVAVLAADEPPPRIARLIEISKFEKLTQLKLLNDQLLPAASAAYTVKTERTQQSELRRLNEELQNAMFDEFNPKRGRKVGDLRKQIRSLQGPAYAKVREVARVAEVKRDIEALQKSKELMIPDLPRTIEKGAVGMLPDSTAEVFQIRGKREALVNVRWQIKQWRRAGYEPFELDKPTIILVLVRGVSTDGLADLGAIKLPQIFEVVDRSPLPTAGNRSVAVLEPFDMNEVARWWRAANP